MVFKKILQFFDREEVVMPDGIDPDAFPRYGRLYKLENEDLPFRYVYCRGDEAKGIHRFKHHQLKEYTLYDFVSIEREANEQEIKLYNKIKEHINDIARKENNFNNN